MEPKRVLCWSPGVDSFLAEWVLRKRREEFSKIYFNIGSMYSKNELDFIEMIYGDETGIFINNSLDLSYLERPDAWLPNRNLILATMAQSLFDADEVLFSCPKDDRCYDQTEHFFNLCSQTISESVNKKVVVKSVLDTTEKSEWVGHYSEMNGFEAGLNLADNTYSCYSPYWKHSGLKVYTYIDNKFEDIGRNLKIFGCLKCKACVRKFVALTSANIYLKLDDNKIVYESLTAFDKELYPSRYKSLNKYIKFIEEVK